MFPRKEQLGIYYHIIIGVKLREKDVLHKMSFKQETIHLGSDQNGIVSFLFAIISKRGEVSLILL